MSHLRHDHHRLRTLRRVRRARRLQVAFAGSGSCDDGRQSRRRRGGYDFLVMQDDIETLEELQRDLEEAAADVAERIMRLRATETSTTDEL